MNEYMLIATIYIMSMIAVYIKGRKDEEKKDKVAILQHIAFRKIIKLMIRERQTFRARWISMQVGGLSVQQSQEYVESCMADKSL